MMEASVLGLVWNGLGYWFDWAIVSVAMMKLLSAPLYPKDSIMLIGSYKTWGYLFMKTVDSTSSLLHNLGMMKRVPYMFPMLHTKGIWNPWHHAMFWSSIVLVIELRCICIFIGCILYCSSVRVHTPFLYSWGDGVKFIPSIFWVPKLVVGNVLYYEGMPSRIL
ncbi:hypothetical protein R6Q59_024828 [Mikania micrantha]